MHILQFSIINFLVFSFLLLTLFVIKKSNPRFNIYTIWVVIVVALVPLLSMLRSGTYESGDLSLHASRAMVFFDSLKEGVIFPNWAGELNAGYGYPLFLFIYPLPYYLISFFHFIGFSFISSTKLVLAGAFISSGLAMYVFIKEFLKNSISASIAAIVYLFAPYHLIDLHFRVAIGEVVSFIFLPLIALSFYKLIKVNNKNWILIGAISYALLILSHQATALAGSIFFLAFVFYTFFHLNKLKRLLYLFKSGLIFLLGLLLSAFYWVPAVLESKFTHQVSIFDVRYQSLKEFIYSPWRFGFLFQGPSGELSFLIGYSQLFIIGVSIFLILKRKGLSKKEGKLMKFLISAYGFTFLMMLSISKSVWKLFPILLRFQFAYRMLVLIAFIGAIIAGVVVKKIRNKRFLLIICLFTILYTFFNWGNRRTIPEIKDATLRYDLPIVTKNEEGLMPAVPKWINPSKPWSDSPKQHLQILKGVGNIREIERSSIAHKYEVEAIGSLVLKENTLYFPGWRVVIDTKPTEITFENNGEPGIIFKIPPGRHIIEVIFTDTKIRTIARLISLASFSVILFLVLFQRFSFGGKR